MLTKADKEFLIIATQRYLEEVKSNITPNEQFLEFSTQEKYVEFLEKLIKKLEK